MELNFRSMLWACWKSRDGQPQGTSHPSFNYGAGEAGAETGALSQGGGDSCRLHVKLSFSEESQGADYHTK